MNNKEKLTLWIGISFLSISCLSLSENLISDIGWAGVWTIALLKIINLSRRQK